MKTKPIAFLLTLAAVLTGHCLALTLVTENFDGAKLDKNLWNFYKYGKARFSQSNGKLNFLVSNPPTKNDYINMELQASQPGMYEDWEMILELTNDVTSGKGSQASPGFMLANEQDYRDYLYVNFFGTSGVDAGYYNDLVRSNAKPLSTHSGAKQGAVKVSYSKKSQLMTFFASPVFEGEKERYLWIRIGTFAPNGNGSGKKNVNADWKMDPASGRFRIQLTGFAISQAVLRNKISMDNFSLLPPP